MESQSTPETGEDLAAFLRARLDEDEQVARAATPGPWVAVENYPDTFLVQSDAPSLVDMAEWPAHQSANVASESSHGDLQTGDAMHIARHDPARVLADVEARRGILRNHGDQHDCGDPRSYDYPYVGCCDLRLLALSYAAHADYRQEWAP